MASSSVREDKYRPFMREDSEKNIKWRYGAPPNYDVVNKLFDEGRTKVWPPGSLEEKVQTLVKNWEMEMFHKEDFKDNRSVDPEKYTFSLNGRKPISLEEKRKLGGGYIPLLQTSIPEKLRPYNPYEETADSSHKAFTTTFPRGFALEILHVYSGPPVIVYKFRHWGYMEGPFKGHLPKSSVPITNGQAVTAPPPPPPPPPRRTARHEEVVDAPPQEDDGFVSRHSHMKYELRDSPGLVPIGVYGIQHYFSILGSLILIPLVIVPAMGGSHEDTSAVASTVLFVSGVTTLLHTSFGSRLPLIQGPSFVYLAPVLAIINSPEFQGLNANKFKHIMKELQGAIIIGSAFQTFIGYSGLMSLLVRLINPVVVSPTIAAVGLSFYSYGFPLVGTCLEIGAVQILVVIVFSLYLRKISVLGHRIFLIYAVPLGLAITWAVAFLLTEAGVYNYKGCDINIPASNMVSEHCRKHVSRMKHCRVDTSNALKSSPWFRFPYPLQWGTPIFHWKMALVMCVVSLISSVDSVGSYHASSLLVASRPPTPGVLSRGIGLEGLSSVLAGLWGTGTGSTTLTENVHTIAVTKMGSRRAVQLGACFLIVLSLVGKVGGFIASIPEVMVAGLLCFMWAMLAALGLSNLRYSEAGSSRNIIIIGLSLFFSLSIPAYFQQYGISPNSNLSVPSYFQPYIVASHGPFHSKYGGLNYFLNTIFSLHMVVAFLVAVILDNTVPGSKQERGVYVWSEPEVARREPAVANDYELPLRVGKIFRWVKWVGL